MLGKKGVGEREERKRGKRKEKEERRKKEEREKKDCSGLFEFSKPKFIPFSYFRIEISFCVILVVFSIFRNYKTSSNFQILIFKLNS